VTVTLAFPNVRVEMEMIVVVAVAIDVVVSGIVLVTVVPKVDVARIAAPTMNAATIIATAILV
jgi:hypothetical protein